MLNCIAKRRRRPHTALPALPRGGTSATYLRQPTDDTAPQAAKKLDVLREELIDPWFMPPPAPLTDTLPPAQLADADSRFIDVHGVRLHYKQVAGELHPIALY